MVRVIFLHLFVLLFASCSSGMYELLTRSNDDPAVEEPKVTSFKESNTINVSWDYDECADEYILERAEDSYDALIYQTVYSGNDLEFTDSNLDNEKRYIYRLSKRRGNKIFGPSNGILGISSLVRRDIYNNDKMEDALRLETIDYIANIYYYRSYSGVELVDEDWYYIEIPPLRQASVVVNDSQVTAEDTPTHFMYYEHARDSKPVYQLMAFWIINTELETKKYYFKIFPEKFEFVGKGIPAGGSIVQYRIKIGNIEPIK